ncbi:MAG: sugar phosphate isomerase/epimerase family protein [Promethearchaeota archaeon]|jgi:sugar phosphate isomerase/epimerase
MKEMELGISSLGYIVEYGLSKKYDNLPDLVYKASEDCLEFAEKNGIKTVELVLEPPDVIYGENQQDFIDLVNSYSLERQVHGPFIDVNLCSHNTIISNASVESYSTAVQFCNRIDVNLLTIHPGLGNFLINSIREHNKVQLTNSIYKLLDTAKNLPISICLENMPQNCNIMLDEKDIEATFQKINRPDVFITYDTSHFFTCDGDVKVLWNKFHKKIKNIHIVDNSSKTSDKHPPLGTGNVDFHEIFEVIKSYSYTGSLIIELSTAKDLAQSINFLNRFL